MTRVSENSSTSALQYAIGKTKSRLEDLNLKGASLKNINKPSDNPLSSVESLALNSANKDNAQFLRNINHASLQLTATEQAIEQLTDLMVKAKEIAIAQASDFYNEDVRSNVAQEIKQIYNQVLSIANNKVGPRYIFGGYKSLERPFTAEGKYLGDDGVYKLEIAKNYFAPINLTGKELFFGMEKDIGQRQIHSINSNQNEKKVETINSKEKEPIELTAPKVSRGLASVEDKNSKNESEDFYNRTSLFGQLQTFVSALENNDSKTIQNLLEKFDSSVGRLITLRTQVGSLLNTLETSRQNIEAEVINNSTLYSKLVDADVAELMSDLGKQQDILKVSYKTSNQMINQNLLDFLK